MITNIVSRYCGRLVFIYDMYRTASFDNKVQTFLIEKKTDRLKIAANPLKLKNFDVYINFTLPLFVPRWYFMFILFI
jgi:hypothetical protein